MGVVLVIQLEETRWVNEALVTWARAMEPLDLMNR
ncbi:hypothetical protein PC129_g12153 [Phytophthora cactorum]|uniref:Uncharacterized protein n=1 Tax=Phytophthora cactorum TaxID=29920 RepID=A0A329RFL7_9STRA|nr:hypothetical protein Pcac1_g20338 [Phytophthora cactorum]KAG2813902.1 hypothetical protein PC112_g14539 [Phytophthora cactorum]KAG2817041.1 hypothetical protein PC111_g12877 [Phytophthora cactorum]KAG2853519.1 hypothetical protein PC113_g14108 [Phytophthora cactorum]KAG2896325.1 hypothetical protein PC114_g15140 [Phytophthora cactorum]